MRIFWIFGMFFFIAHFPFSCYILCMTITQTVDIPANRRLYLDLEIPLEVKADKAYVTIQFPVSVKSYSEPTAVPKKGNKKIGMTRAEIDEFLKNAHTPISDSLLGILKTDMTLDEIRMARLAKHL